MIAFDQKLRTMFAATSAHSVERYERLNSSANESATARAGELGAVRRRSRAGRRLPQAGRQRRRFGARLCRTASVAAAIPPTISPESAGKAM